MDIHYVFSAEITGSIDEIRAIADRLIAASQDEPGTVQYQWYLDEGAARLHVHEGFDSSEALVAHVRNAQPLLGELLQHCAPVGLQAFGEPDEKAAGVIARMGGRVAAPIGGFSR